MKRLIKYQCTALFVFLTTIFLACGGGTTGTGELVNRNLSGQITDQDSKALSAVKITVLESGDTTSTSSNGQFELSTQVPAGDFNLLIETSDFEKTVKVTNFEANKKDLILDIKVNVTGKDIVLLSVKVKDNATDDDTNDKDDTDLDNDKEDEPDSEEITNSIIRGQIVFLDNSPASGVKVILDNKTSVSTNKSGFFKFEKKITKTVADLNFQYNKSTGGIKLSNLPKKPFIIEVKIQIKIDPNQINANVSTEDIAVLISKDVKRR
jgi:hypothetical protein